MSRPRRRASVDRRRQALLAVTLAAAVTGAAWVAIGSFDTRGTALRSDAPTGARSPAAGAARLIAGVAGHWGAAAPVAALGVVVLILLARPLVRARGETSAAARLAFDQAAVGLAHVALDGRYLRVNRRFCEVTGYSEGELLARSFRDLTHPEDLASGRHLDGRLVTGEVGEYRAEVRYTHRSGRVVWIDLAVALVRGRDGSPRHFVSAISDVTARRHAEARVARLNRLLQTTRKVNLLLGGMRDRARLIEEACHVLVEVGGFAGARVALGQGGRETSAAHVGRAWSEAAAGSAVPAHSGLAPAGGGTTLIRGVPWAACGEGDRPPGHGATVAVAPLLAGGRGVGTLAVAAEADDGLDAEIVAMLEEVASDLGVGLRAIALEEERERAEEALRDSEVRFRAAFEAGASGMSLTAPDGRLLMVNDAFAAMVGRDRATLLAGDWRGITHPDDVAASAEVVRSLLAGERDTARFEKRYLTPAGAEVIADVSTHLVRDGAGAPLYFVTHAGDITLQRQAQDELRTLAAAIEQAAAPVIITDVEGTIRYVNPAFERVTGYARREAVGANPRLLKSGVQDDDFYRSMWSTLAAGEVWQGRFVNRRKDGSLYDEEATISPVRDESGRIVNYVASKRDVTEEEHLRSQLAQAQKMEAVGRLAGGIAHDFNNLLQAMLGFAGAWKAAAGGAGGDARRLAELEELIGRGAAMTRQLLLFSRREAAAPCPLDLNEAVLSSARLLRRLLRENVAIEVEPAAEPLAVRADAGQLDQVVMNLAVNAGDAMPGGGRLTLRTRRAGDRAILEVSDSGHGIPAAIRERIFEPFFTTKGIGKGTGLGLSVVHGIVARHGGTVAVESEVGAGTLFRIVLPIEAVADGARANAPAAVEPAPAAPAGVRVLLVEDEGMLREGLVSVLAGLGHHAVAVASGEDALALDDAAGFDLVLTDLSLPGISGIEVAGELAARRPDVRIVLMSGYPEGSLDAAAARRIHGYLEKPFDMRTLGAAIARALAAPAAGAVA